MASACRLPCSICEAPLTNPCKLPCGHEFCLSCVQNMVTTEQRSHNLSCPLCRAVFTISVLPHGSLEQPAIVKEKYGIRIDRSPGCGPLRHDAKIMGMAILQDDLFVVCKKPGVVYQYYINTQEPFSGEPRTVSIPDLKWPRGITANDSLRLYITDWSSMFQGRLWRYDCKNGKSTVGANLDVQPFGVSYSSRNDTIIVTCATPLNVVLRRGWIYVYRDFGTKLDLLQTLELDSVEIPRHTVLTFADNYLVCHGWTLAQHGLTSFQQSVTKEITRKAFYGSNLGGGGGEFEMKRPLSMTIDEDGLILAVDYYNHRIQLLTEDLRLLRHLVTKAHHGIEYPRHVCVHQKTGRLFVGLEDGSVEVFDFR